MSSLNGKSNSISDFQELRLKVDQSCCMFLEQALGKQNTHNLSVRILVPYFETLHIFISQIWGGYRNDHQTLFHHGNEDFSSSDLFW